MAEQMQDIKRRIKSIGSTERITNAMKLVSAAKLRHAKSVYEHSRSYLGRIIASIDEAFDDDTEVPGYLLKGNREIKTTCVIMLTSSTGLCGSFNGNVIRATEDVVAELGNEVKMVNIGTKGKDYFAVAERSSSLTTIRQTPFPMSPPRKSWSRFWRNTRQERSTRSSWCTRSMSIR